jgi:hypothetical protein
MNAKDSMVADDPSTSPRLSANLIHQALAPPPPLFLMSRDGQYQAPLIHQQHDRLFANPHQPLSVLEILDAAIRIVDFPRHADGAPSRRNVAVIEPDEDDENGMSSGEAGITSQHSSRRRHRPSSPRKPSNMHRYRRPQQ